MEGLKEFGTNFLLTAGEGIADNMKEQSKQDKADVLAQTALLRKTIATNKAADAKLQKNITGQANTLLNLAPSLPQELLRQALVSDDSYKQFKKTIEDDIDSGKSGYFLSSWAKQNNMEPNSIYKTRETRKPTSTIVSELRTPASIPTKSKPVSTDTESVLKTLFGAGMGSDRILDEAEKSIIGNSGRGSVGRNDMRYAYNTPTRGISRSDKPASFDRVQEQSGSQLKAIQAITPKYYKKVYDILAPQGTTNRESTDENIRSILYTNGIDRKINAVLSAAMSGSQKKVGLIIEQQFKTPSTATEEEKKEYLAVRATLRSTILRDYADELTTFGEVISNQSKDIVKNLKPIVN